MLREELHMSEITFKICIWGKKCCYQNVKFSHDGFFPTIFFYYSKNITALDSKIERSYIFLFCIFYS